MTEPGLESARSMVKQATLGEQAAEPRQLRVAVHHFRRKKYADPASAVRRGGSIPD